ncbi:MAG: amino acid--[acyl-carrier-protein] ligase [Mycobacterium sp.]
MTTVEIDIETARREFRDQLIEAGLLIPMGIDGLFGRGAVFENVIDGIDVAVRRKGQAVHGDSATVLRFPPLFSRAAFEGTDYIASFPNLTGSVSTFTGGDREHRDLLEDRASGNGWDHHLHPAGTMLVSAACHPSYSTLDPQLPPDGRLLDVYGYCFRHEPAIDPARMQAFRMHEYVRVGTPEQAVEHRETWIGHGLAMLAELGLDAAPVAANDPFFGRAGRMLAANQHAENLKTELVIRLYGDLTDGTAVVSSNCHQDHFGTTFALRTADGEVAHSACVGFGMERIALALFRTHGLDPATWPISVRAAMTA